MLSRVFKFVSVLLSVHLILERWANLGHPVKCTKNYLPLLKPKKKSNVYRVVPYIYRQFVATLFLKKLLIQKL